MKQLITYIVACLWCLATLIPLQAQGLKSFLSGGVASTSAPIEYVGAAANNFAATRSPTVNLPVVNDNDIMILILSSDTSHDSNGSLPSGWTKLDMESDVLPDHTSSTFWKRAVSGDSGGTVSFANVFAATEDGIAVVVAYRNCVATGSPFNAEGSVGGGNITGHDTPSITPSINNCMIVGIITIDPGATPRAFTWDGGIDERVGSGTSPSGQNGTLAAVYVADQIQATAAPITLGGDFATAEHASRYTYALTPQ